MQIIFYLEDLIVTFIDKINKTQKNTSLLVCKLYNILIKYLNIDKKNTYAEISDLITVFQSKDF